jgi:hypothetical protein
MRSTSWKPLEPAKADAMWSTATGLHGAASELSVALQRLLPAVTYRPGADAMGQYRPSGLYEQKHGPVTHFGRARLPRDKEAEQRNRNVLRASSRFIRKIAAALGLHQATCFARKSHGYGHTP